MAPQQFITMANKFQSVLDADVLNERGQQVGFAKRERLITPFRLGLSVVASMNLSRIIKPSISNCSNLLLPSSFAPHCATS